MDQADIKEKFTKPFGEWIDKNFQSKKQAAAHLHVSQSMLSQIMHGTKKPPKKFILTCSKWGCDTSIFAILEGINEIESDVLTYTEIKYMYLEMKKVAEQKDTVIRHQEEIIQRLMDRCKYYEKQFGKL